jgi:8-oxo-dGTP pyrophosphatase MutT (NUDIX family)
MDSLHIILKYLPHYAQEGHYFTSVAREALITAIHNEGGMSHETAATVVMLAERLLTASTVLNEEMRQQGRWQFQSFPAYLCALSVLNTLADPQQYLFPAGFWDASPYQHETTLQAQHHVLSWLENRRVEYHAEQSPQPARICFVAAGFIKIHGKFWLHRRESRTIRDNNGEYVLPGGRTLFADLQSKSPSTSSGNGGDERLRLLNTSGVLPPVVVENTLKRELQEEIGLQAGDDYQFKVWRKLPACRQLSGASSNFSYTEYVFTLFTLKLTWTGLFKLYQAHQGGQLAEFSQAELLAGQNAAGQTAYVDMLDVTELAEIEDSLAPSYRFDSATQAIVLPFDDTMPLRQGAVRHESVVLDAGVLTQKQCAVLWLLGAHGKGWDVCPANGVTLLPYGWVRLAETHREAARELAVILKDSALLEIITPDYLRLAIAPALIFFAPRNFSYLLDEKQRTISFTHHAVDSAWGEVKAQVSPACHLPDRLLVAIRDLEQGKTVLFSRQDSLESLARASLEKDGRLHSIGLRKFLRIEKQRYRLAIER